MQGWSFLFSLIIWTYGWIIEPDVWRSALQFTAIMTHHQCTMVKYGEIMSNTWNTYGSFIQPLLDIPGVEMSWVLTVMVWTSWSKQRSKKYQRILAITCALRFEGWVLKKITQCAAPKILTYTQFIQNVYHSCGQTFWLGWWNTGFW